MSEYKIVNKQNDPLPDNATQEQIDAWEPRINVTIPLTDDEILEKSDRKKKYDLEISDLESKNYLKNRLSEYPSIQDQLLMLWSSMDSGEIPKCKAFYEGIASVNKKYPG